MRKLSNNRRAVSPVIATVLMILITMMGMTLLFGFVSSYSENYKAGIGSSVMESITVEDIWLQSTAGSYTNQVHIWVYNVGKIDLVVNSIYVNASALTSGSGNPNLNIAIKAGEHKEISATCLQNYWVSRNTYVFQVSTQRGSNFEQQYVAP
jgi:flagellin-like protein